jgi:hypothetical protein
MLDSQLLDAASCCAVAAAHAEREKRESVRTSFRYAVHMLLKISLKSGVSSKSSSVIASTC